MLRLNQTSVETFDESRRVVKNHAVAVLEDRAGELWIAGHGLHRFENGKFVRVPGVRIVFQLSLGELRGGTLLIGGYNTLYAGQNGVFTDWLRELKTVLNKREFTVKAIHEDSAGALWLGLQNEGVLRRDAGGAYRQFTKENGLSGDTVQFIVNNDNANKDTIVSDDNANKTTIVNNDNANRAQIINNDNANKDFALRLQIELNLAAPPDTTAHVALFAAPTVKGCYLELARSIIVANMGNLTLPATNRQQAEGLLAQGDGMRTAGDYIQAYTLYRRAYRIAMGMKN